MLSKMFHDWILVESHCVEGLGQGELLQSRLTPTDYRANIILNSYESNCLRDWLAQRWKLKSMEQTCLSLHEGFGMLITLPVNAKSLLDAKDRFEIWLGSVCEDRRLVAQSRD